MDINFQGNTFTFNAATGDDKHDVKITISSFGNALRLWQKKAIPFAEVFFAAWHCLVESSPYSANTTQRQAIEFMAENVEQMQESELVNLCEMRCEDGGKPIIAVIIGGCSCDSRRKVVEFLSNGNHDAILKKTVDDRSPTGSADDASGEKVTIASIIAEKIREDTSASTDRQVIEKFSQYCDGKGIPSTHNKSLTRTLQPQSKLIPSKSDPSNPMTQTLNAPHFPNRPISTNRDPVIPVASTLPPSTSPAADLSDADAGAAQIPIDASPPVSTASPDTGVVSGPTGETSSAPSRDGHMERALDELEHSSNFASFLDERVEEDGQQMSLIGFMLKNSSGEKHEIVRQRIINRLQGLNAVNLSCFLGLPDSAKIMDDFLLVREGIEFYAVNILCNCSPDRNTEFYDMSLNAIRRCFTANKQVFCDIIGKTHHDLINLFLSHPVHYANKDGKRETETGNLFQAMLMDEEMCDCAFFMLGALGGDITKETDFLKLNSEAILEYAFFHLDDEHLGKLLREYAKCNIYIDRSKLLEQFKARASGLGGERVENSMAQQPSVSVRQAADLESLNKMLTDLLPPEEERGLRMEYALRRFNRCVDRREESYPQETFEQNGKKVGLFDFIMSNSDETQQQEIRKKFITFLQRMSIEAVGALAKTPEFVQIVKHIFPEEAGRKFFLEKVLKSSIISDRDQMAEFGDVIFDAIKEDFKTDNTVLVNALYGIKSASIVHLLSIPAHCPSKYIKAQNKPGNLLQALLGDEETFRMANYLLDRLNIVEKKHILSEKNDCGTIFEYAFMHLGNGNFWTIVREYFDINTVINCQHLLEQCKNHMSDFDNIEETDSIGQEISERVKLAGNSSESDNILEGYMLSGENTCINHANKVVDTINSLPDVNVLFETLYPDGKEKPGISLINLALRDASSKRILGKDTYGISTDKPRVAITNALRSLVQKDGVIGLMKLPDSGQILEKLFAYADWKEIFVNEMFSRYLTSNNGMPAEIGDIILKELRKEAQLGGGILMNKVKSLTRYPKSLFLNSKVHLQNQHGQSKNRTENIFFAMLEDEDLHNLACNNGIVNGILEDISADDKYDLLQHVLLNCSDEAIEFIGHCFVNNNTQFDRNKLWEQCKANMETCGKAKTQEDFNALLDKFFGPDPELAKTDKDKAIINVREKLENICRGTHPGSDYFKEEICLDGQKPVSFMLFALKTPELRSLALKAIEQTKDFSFFDQKDGVQILENILSDPEGKELFVSVIEGFVKSGSTSLEIRDRFLKFLNEDIQSDKILTNALKNVDGIHVLLNRETHCPNQCIKVNNGVGSFLEAMIEDPIMHDYALDLFSGMPARSKHDYCNGNGFHHIANAILNFDDTTLKHFMKELNADGRGSINRLDCDKILLENKAAFERIKTGSKRDNDIWARMEAASDRGKFFDMLFNLPSPSTDAG
jgi:hypothetical protein